MIDTNDEMQFGETMTPGQTLRAKREKLGLGVESIAQKLFLGTQKIVDLENDDYSHINSLSFAKGYLRAYAKIVDVSEEEILQKFAKLDLSNYSGLKTEIGKEPQTIITHKNRGILQLVNIAIIIFLLIMVVIWWHNKNRTPAKGDVSPVVPQQVVTTS